MNLGENIHRLRKARNMSQDALAESLDVSRQSVSKWENNSATPDLDKLIKMSELFGITLDELVGKETSHPCEASGSPPPASSAQSVHSSAPPTRPALIAGIILLCFGFLAFLILSILGGLFGGILYSLPFFLFAAICLLSKTRAGLKCCWAGLILITEYLTMITGTSRRTLFTYLATDLSNYLDYPYIVYTIISLIINMLLIGLIIRTVRSCNRNFPPMTRGGKRLLIAGWVVFLLLCLIPAPHFEYDYHLIRIHSLILSLTDWIKVGLFTSLLTYTLRLLPKRKENP